MNELDLYARAMSAALQSGTVSVPVLFLQVYKRLGITDAEAMLLLQIHSFMERERNDFPTPEQLQERVSATESSILGTLQKLLASGLIHIQDGVEAVSGIRYERYDLTALWRRAAQVWAADSLSAEDDAASGGVKPPQSGIRPTVGAAPASQAADAKANDLFTMFEREFARPLSPMELENIVKWLDADRYPEPLIVSALKEAVFAGKLHFRYIDRILLEWSRNRVQTVEQAKEYTQRFRGMR